MPAVIVSPRLRDPGRVVPSADRLRCDVCSACVLVWSGQWHPRGPSAVLCMVCAGPLLNSGTAEMMLDGRTAEALASELGWPPEEVSWRVRALADRMGWRCSEAVPSMTNMDRSTPPPHGGMVGGSPPRHPQLR